jgi:hypothetical protein
MHDNRVIQRPFLGGIDTRNRIRVQGIRAQTVNSLSWKRHKPAFLYYFSGCPHFLDFRLVTVNLKDNSPRQN